MSVGKAISAGCFALWFCAGGAVAATIANQDGNDHTLTIVEGGDSSERVLKHNSVIEDVCKKGCVVRLNKAGGDYRLRASDMVVIENGYLYYAGPEQPEAPETPKTAVPRG